MPNQKPMIPVETTSQMRLRSSPSVSRTSPNPTFALRRSTKPIPDSSAEARISPIPNSPIVTGTKPMPDRIPICPNVRRGWPVIVSKPTAARSSPKPIIITAFTGDSAPSPMSVAKDMMNTANSSGGPNERAKSARARAKNVNITVARNAPTNEAKNDEASATPGLPLRFASGNPSKRSTTDHGSPGMLNRIEVTTPPNRAPQYTPASRMTALVGLVRAMMTVIGRRIATALVPPRPGSTPTTSPRITPMKSMKMLNGCRAVANPPARSPKTFRKSSRLLLPVHQNGRSPA